MKLTNKHKSLIITCLTSGTLVMAMFNFHIKKHSDYIAESFYEIEAKTEDELRAETEDENQSQAETNQAFNKTKTYKQFAQAYQPIAPPKDYVYKPTNRNSNNKSTNTSNSLPEIDEKILTSYSNVNVILNKQRNTISEQSVNKKSSMHYSLVNRTHLFLPTPIYLCETGGKVVINITVNYKGNVTNTSVNKAASTNNGCLTDHALEYAKEARFNADSKKKTQLGSITFYFESK